MFWIGIVVLLFILLFIALLMRHFSRRSDLKPCERCGTNGSMLFASTEVPHMHICEECAWVEYQHKHKADTWATEHHT